jgi:1-acyl-sn-glycerol-3-phosphate acyltransferase
MRGLLRILGGFFLAASGWRIKGEKALPAKLVIVGAPHTSNWDAFLFLCAINVMRVDVGWLAKKELFAGPFRGLFLSMGGIPVDRGDPGGTVARIAERFAASDQLRLAMTPEGTRARRDRWKSGFYRIARGAGVPVLCAGFDYGRREMVIGEPIELSGDAGADMDRIRAFFAPLVARHPELVSPMRIREEREDE